MNVRSLSIVGISALAAATWFASPALAQFSSDPLAQLALTTSGGTLQKIRRIPSGGYYVAWQGQQGTGENTYVQRLDANGNQLWTVGGIAVTDSQYNGSFEGDQFGFDIDANENAIVAYRDNHTGTLNIALQKVTPAGTTPWGPNGIVIPGGPVGSTDVPHTPGVVCTSDGGYVVRFSRGTTSVTATSRACYQKSDTNGNLLWNSGQAIVLAPATNGYTAIDMAPSDSGSTIVFFYSVGGFTTSRRILVQKLDSATGNRLWNGGTAVAIQTTGTIPVGSYPQVLSDGSNGALVCWADSASPAAQCRVQHVDSAGNLLFPANGATATAAAVAGQQREYPYVEYNQSTHTTYMFYREEEGVSSPSYSSCYGQAFDATGNRLWGSSGLAVTPITPTAGYTAITERASLTTGGVIVSWFESTTANTTQVVRAAKVTDAGALAWASPITVDSNTSPKNSMAEASAPAGPAVICYGDYGYTFVTVSRINDDGTIGNPVASTGSCCTNNTCHVTSSDDCANIYGGAWTAGGTCTDSSSCFGGHFCGSADFNCDGDVGTDADIEAFFSCLAGTCPALPCISSADFNGDGDIGTDADIEAFFRVLGGSPC